MTFQEWCQAIKTKLEERFGLSEADLDADPEDALVGVGPLRFHEWSSTRAIAARWIDVFVDGQPMTAGFSATPTWALAASWSRAWPGKEIQIVENLGTVKRGG